MTGLRSAAASLAAAAMMAAPLSAAAGGPAAITLRQALEATLRDSDLVGAGEAAVAAAAGGVEEARSGLLPRVAFEEKFLRTDNPAYVFSSKINQGKFTGEDLAGAPGSFNDPGPLNSFTTSLQVSQPLYSRRASLGLRMSQAERGASELDLTRRREEAAYGTYRAFLAALTAEAYLRTALVAEEDAGEHLRLARLMEETEVGLLSDRLRAEVALAEAQRARLRVANDVEISRRGLALAMGVEGAFAPLDGPLPEEEGDLESLVAAVDGRSDVLAMEARVRNGELGVDLARAGRLPEVGLFGFLQADSPELVPDSDGTSYGAGVLLTWSIYDGKSAESKARKALAEAEGAGRALAGLKKQARFRVREAHLRVGEARQSLAIADRALGAAEEGVRLVRVRYENGLSSMVALLDAQAALNIARAEAVRARMELLGAVAEVRYRAGTLLRELLPAADPAAGTAGVRPPGEPPSAAAGG